MSPFRPSIEELNRLSRQALETVWQQYSDTLGRPDGPERTQHSIALAHVFYFNVRSGRWEYILGVDARCDDTVRAVALEKYAMRVARSYATQHVWVSRLERCESEAWEELRGQLVRKACFVLHGRFNVSMRAAFSQAEDHAQHACECIYKTRFPYDVDFGAWAARILVNCVLGSRTRSTDVLDRRATLDADLSALVDGSPVDQVARKAWQSVALRQENSQLLLETMQHLPNSQQHVLWRTYVDQWSAEAIAVEMGKSIQAVYNLRTRGLQRLNAILSDEVNDESGA